MAPSGSSLRARWLDLIAGALKQDDPDAALATLRSTTYDGIAIEPLYTLEDAIDEREIGMPGAGSLVRGARAAGTRPGGWDVRQRVDAAAGPGRAAEELERGATSIWLDLAAIDDLDRAIAGALDGVLLGIAPVVLGAGSRWPEAATVLAARWSSGGAPPAGGSLGADPFGSWAADRSSDLDDDVIAAANWARRLAVDAPAVRTVTVDGTRYHDAGASDAQELGYTVAAAVAIARALAESGLDDPFGAIELRLAATADQFATIAKFRAAREVWSRITSASGSRDSAARTPVHAVMSTAMMTAYDPAVNMLRGTVACFAAAVAGADAITVAPYDLYSSDAPSELGRRLARNTQSVLAMESHVHRVIDPVGGSWYVERLTDQLAAAAWREFQDVEAAGGFRAAVEADLLADRIAEVRGRRDADIDHRRSPLTGSTAFPNVAEPPPTRPAPDPAPDGPLPAQRWAERFEALRRRVDRHADRTGERPVMYLATLGGASDHTARATFAQQLFEVAGLKTVSGPVEDFAASGATVACLCSSERVYADSADAAVSALTAAGARAVYTAGREPVVLGGDARAALGAVLEVMEIP